MSAELLRQGPLNKEMLIVGVVADTVLSSASRLNAGAAPLTKEEIIYLPAPQVVDAKFLSLLHTWFQPSWIASQSEVLVQQAALKK
ncbi:MAG: hypothetical protein DMG49_05265 [Acidobacteria bacterium]|nr:MAG: hypothetical protein DMG49_05265 [Acidobacteriota bacterium]PYV90151.1 MAG: hypothetical protein DMG90_09805 [Acidobacteriota bacterium]